MRTYTFRTGQKTDFNNEVKMHKFKAFLKTHLNNSVSVLSPLDWDDVVVVREGMSTTLICTDTTVRGALSLNWMVKSLGTDEWKLVLSASERKMLYGGASKASMELTDPNFQDTGVFSLFFLPKMEDSGLYSCSIKQQEKNPKQRIILLAILTGRKISRLYLYVYMECLDSIHHRYSGFQFVKPKYSVDKYLTST